MPSTISKNKPQPSSWQFDAIGTRWIIETAQPLDDQLQSKITGRIERFDQIYSRFRDDSVVAEMEKQAGYYELSHDGMAELYRKLYEATDGAMTPLIGGSLVAAGYDKDYSFAPTAPLPAKKWDEAFDWNGSVVTTTEPVALDVGALGKGQLVDIVGQQMEAAGVTEYVIDASGDIRHRGKDIQTIGLEDPADPTRVIGTVPLGSASLCASAINRRRWGTDWHHVIDGRTGEPVNAITATWVIAETTMLADGLATALFFVGSDKLHAIADFQFVRLFADGRIEHSPDFVGQLFI
jgi:thiamine biosynthesis lipoprotein